ncbi:MAG: DUF58 domain-containing protein [Phycisphaerales bacterium]
MATPATPELTSTGQPAAPKPRSWSPLRRRGRQPRLQDGIPEDERQPKIIGRRYHLYPPSVFYIVVTIFIGLGAFNAQNNLLFFVFGATLATLIVSGVVSGSMMMSVTVRRIIASDARIGLPAPITYRVTNLNKRLPMFAIRIRELPARPSAGRAADQRTLQAAEGALGPATAFAGFVPRGGSIDAPSSASPLRAGVVELHTFEVSTVFPFGIARKSVRFAQPSTLVVRHPEVALPPERLPSLAAPGRPPGEASRTRSTSGDEFFGIREYSPGDPLRLIAWRASARSGELRTRVNATPPRSAVRLVIDLDGLDDTPVPLSDPDAPRGREDPLGRVLSWPLRAMGFLEDAPREQPPRFSQIDRALALAGSLASALLTRGDAVEIRDAHGAFDVSIGQGQRQRERIARALAMRRSSGTDAAAPSPRTTTRPSSTVTITLAPEGRTPTRGEPTAPTITFDEIDRALTMQTRRAAGAHRTTRSAPPPRNSNIDPTSNPPGSPQPSPPAREEHTRA